MMAIIIIIIIIIVSIIIRVIINLTYGSHQGISTNNY